MPEKTCRLYAYRWVVLAVFMFINLTIQMLWIAYAPITGPAARVYAHRCRHAGSLDVSRWRTGGRGAPAVLRQAE